MLDLDHNATTPLRADVAEEMARAARDFPGNPSSVHAAGRRARAALDQARADLAAAFGAPDPAQIVFTASGSEANNLAVKGLACGPRPGRPAHLIITAIEHDSVLRAARALALARPGITVSEVAAGADGRVQPEAIAAALRPETRLVCLMLANNETGAVQPVAEVARICRAAGVLLHCDAIQAPGRLPLDFAALGCDSLAISAHKFYGPKGVGALLTRPGLELEPLVHGGHQEGRRRAGTENVAGAIGMALAARLAARSLGPAAARLKELETVFLAHLRRERPDLEINGSADDKIPGVLNLALPGSHQDDLVVGMDLAGVAISAGSACSSGVIEPSHVLTAMNLPRWRIDGGIRISFGAEHTPDDARRAAGLLADLSLRLTSAASIEGAP